MILCLQRYLKNETDLPSSIFEIQCSSNWANLTIGMFSLLETVSMKHKKIMRAFAHICVKQWNVTTDATFSSVKTSNTHTES